MKLKISDYCLIVEDVSKAAEFYKEVVGLPMRFRNENFADFDMGKGARLALWEHAHVSQVVGEDKIGVKGNRTMGAFQVKSGVDVDDKYEELKSKGVNFISHPKDYPWGARAVYFKDPDGYIWEIYSWVQKPRIVEDVD